MSHLLKTVCLTSRGRRPEGVGPHQPGRVFEAEDGVTGAKPLCTAVSFCCPRASPALLEADVAYPPSVFIPLVHAHEPSDASRPARRHGYAQLPEERAQVHQRGAARARSLHVALLPVPPPALQKGGPAQGGRFARAHATSTAGPGDHRAASSGYSACDRERTLVRARHPASLRQPAASRRQFLPCRFLLFFSKANLSGRVSFLLILFFPPHSLRASSGRLRRLVSRVHQRRRNSASPREARCGRHECATRLPRGVTRHPPDTTTHTYQQETQKWHVFFSSPLSHRSNTSRPPPLRRPRRQVSLRVRRRGHLHRVNRGDRPVWRRAR